MDYGLSFQLAAPEIILSVAALVLLMVSAWGGTRSARAVSVLSVAALVAASFVSWNFLFNEAFEFGADAFGGLYRLDKFASFSKLLIFASAAVAVIAAPGFFRREDEFRPEYPVLILTSTIGMGMMVSAVDLMTLYVGLELQSLSAYVLASFLRRDPRSAEAGLKYFVLGALASGILLYGISLLYGFTGTTGFRPIATAFAADLSLGEIFGLVFVLAGLAFKISAAPFHMWTPDVYEGAPTPVTTFFASAPKVAAVALTVRVAIEAMGPATDQWRQIVLFAALLSIVIGAAGAIGQTSLKRLLAYSSINNIGFALIGLGAGGAAGVASVLVYMAIYVPMTLGSFLVLMRLRDRDGQPVEDIAAVAGLSKTRPALALALAIFMFSLAGIPPLFGFWAKFAVFEAAVQAGLLAIAAIGIALSVIGAYYYIKIVKMMYFDEPAVALAPARRDVEGGLIALNAVIVSPLGYLLIPALGTVTAAAASGLIFVP